MIGIGAVALLLLAALAFAAVVVLVAARQERRRERMSAEWQKSQTRYEENDRGNAA